MSVSKTSLVNKALTIVGAYPITSITDDTNNARVVNRVYEISLKSILGECKWNFATLRALLVSSATTMNWYYTPGGWGGGIPMPYNKHQFIVGQPIGLDIRE